MPLCRHSTVAKFDEKIQDWCRSHLLWSGCHCRSLAGVVGRKVDSLNDVFEVTGDLYNGNPLFWKRNDPGGLFEWLRFSTNDKWLFRTTARKDVNTTRWVYEHADGQGPGVACGHMANLYEWSRGRQVITPIPPFDLISFP